MNDDDILGKKKSFIFPIYVAKKDLVKPLTSKPLSEALIIPKSVKKAIPRQCECGRCGGMWFIPGQLNHGVNPDAKIMKGHYGISVREINAIVQAQLKEKIKNRPFEPEDVINEIKKSGLTHRQVAESLNVSINTAKSFKKKYKFTDIELQIKIIKLFPNLKLKEGVDREKFLAEHDVKKDED